MLAALRCGRQPQSVSHSISGSGNEEREWVTDAQLPQLWRTLVKPGSPWLAPTGARRRLKKLAETRTRVWWSLADRVICARLEFSRRLWLSIARMEHWQTTISNTCV